jgi:tetratricopeptide (TPR) repeat protein
LSGEIALEEGQPQLAGEIAEKVLATSPDNSAALVLRVQALEALNRSEEALETISQVIPKTEYPLPLLLEQVHLFYNTQGLQAALSSIQSLASEYPDNPQVLTLLAELLEEAGEDDAAIQILQRAIRCFSETTEAPARQQAQTYYLLGRLMSQSGHLDQAIFHLTEAIQLDPTRIEAYIELGQVHQDRRQHTQALEVYQKAISAAPNNPQVYYQAALALKESKDYIEAERMLRHASELAPDDVKIHRLLGALVALNLVHNLRTQPELSRLNSEYIPSQHGEVKTG